MYLVMTYDEAGEERGEITSCTDRIGRDVRPEYPSSDSPDIHIGGRPYPSCARMKAAAMNHTYYTSSASVKVPRLIINLTPNRVA